MPAEGRLDLRYLIEISSSLDGWTEVAHRDPGSDWTGPATVTGTPLLGLLDRATVTLPRQPSQPFAVLRLRVELVEFP